MNRSRRGKKEHKHEREKEEDEKGVGTRAVEEIRNRRMQGSESLEAGEGKRNGSQRGKVRRRRRNRSRRKE
jgi:hypothetical protein